jgi:SAM-dependent methyltransferase
MIKYVMTAAALKLFSATPQTRRMYRALGNTLGQRRRILGGLNPMYLSRSRKVLEWCERHHAVQPGDRLLEIGTGWLHWWSTIFRLFHDVEATLFDIWDNRQLAAYKHFFGQLERVMDKELDLDPVKSKRAHTLIREILTARSFEEIYDLLDFRYVVDPRGTLECFPSEAFSLVHSCNVLEHVVRGILPGLIQDFHRVLRPGGLSIHTIDLGDHLYYYDKSVSYKNYLRYSDEAWRRYFENDVQYFNRVQRPEWLDLYQRAGFVMLEEESIDGDIGSIEIDDRYKYLDQKSLRCVTLWVVHEKPRR